MNGKRLFYLMIIFGILTSCSKENVIPQGTASLTIINAVAGSNFLVPNFGGTDPLQNYFVNSTQLFYNAYLQSSTNYSQGNEFNTHSGTVRLGMYNDFDTISTGEPLFNLTLDLPVGSISTLFLTGTISSPDTLFVKDTPPYYPLSDSSVGIRFVNLSQGSTPVSINIEGQEKGSEISSLSYKSISEFKKYAADAGVNSYTFEFRDEGSGELLTSYTISDINNDGSDPSRPINLWRYRNVTLALLGVPGGTASSAQQILLINNY